MKRLLVLLFGVASYSAFLTVFLYAIGFIGGVIVPTKLGGPVENSFAEALAIDLLLILTFGLQHSVMARPGFKQWWTRIVPPSIERSTYVLCTNAVLGVLFWQWRSMGGLIWDVQQPTLRNAIWMLFGFGWLTVLATTFLINHFDLFGLRQVWLSFRGVVYSHLPFVTPGPYRLVRHPLYVGWLLAFWSTPTMTVDHIVFALGMTAYILIAIRFEERDLVRVHDGYAEYRSRVPMLIPRFGRPSVRSSSQSVCERIAG